jgi:uncharacterized protein (TIGR00375 family)
MQIAVDLHSHSGYAGGVGKIDLEDVSYAMKLKGIDVFGTGDCIYPQRTKELKNKLVMKKSGLYSLKNDTSYFLLQTEIILSTALSGYKNKIMAHHILLFPDFDSIYKMQNLMTKHNFKNTIGRPFIVTNSRQELEEILFEIKSIHPDLEIIPAHIMTPDGIYGSRNNLHNLKEFYGNFIKNIHAIETGLSADPKMLEKIPDIADLTFISNSDCHSAALNRIGREYTVLDVRDISYKSIIDAIRENKVLYTAEFNPMEGKYYLSGHRKGKFGHTVDYIFIPYKKICPMCGKKVIMGVKERCEILSDNSIIPKTRKFYHLIPLTEVIAYSLGLKSISSAKVKKIFLQIIKYYGSEINLWNSTDFKDVLDSKIPQKTITFIQAVKEGRFVFDPPGFDGVYGKLKIF